MNSVSTNCVAGSATCNPHPLHLLHPPPLTSHHTVALTHTEAGGTEIRLKITDCPCLVTLNKAVIVYFLNLTSNPSQTAVSNTLLCCFLEKTHPSKPDVVQKLRDISIVTDSLVSAFTATDLIFKMNNVSNDCVYCKKSILI